jgi:hypothetical protein
MICRNRQVPIRVAGLLLSSFLQSGFMRRQISRLGLEKNHVAILTVSISLFAFLGFVVIGLNLGGLPIPWDAKVPAIGLSLSQIFQLVVLVAIVFWFASAAKRFLFNRFLSKSGLDRSVQYTIAFYIDMPQHKGGDNGEHKERADTLTRLAMVDIWTVGVVGFAAAPAASE